MPSPKSNTAKGRAAGALTKPVQPEEVLAALVGRILRLAESVVESAWSLSPP